MKYALKFSVDWWKFRIIECFLFIVPSRHHHHRHPSPSHGNAKNDPLAGLRRGFILLDSAGLVELVVSFSTIAMRRREHVTSELGMCESILKWIMCWWYFALSLGRVPQSFNQTIRMNYQQLFEHRVVLREKALYYFIISLQKTFFKTQFSLKGDIIQFLIRVLHCLFLLKILYSSITHP